MFPAVSAYTYDESGLRVKKISGGITTDYHLVEGSLVAETRSDGKSLMYLYDTAGRKNGFVYNGDFYFYDFNLQG